MKSYIRLQRKKNIDKWKLMKIKKKLNIKIKFTVRYQESFVPSFSVCGGAMTTLVESFIVMKYFQSDSYMWLPSTKKVLLGLSSITLKIFNHYEALDQWECSNVEARPMRAKPAAVTCLLKTKIGISHQHTTKKVVQYPKITKMCCPGWTMRRSCLDYQPIVIEFPRRFIAG